MQNKNTSEFITDVGYDSMNENLRVSFRRSGNQVTSYSYGSVPRNIADGLLAASSKGKYFNSNIRGRFPATRVVS
jgi:hypothetical protein